MTEDLLKPTILLVDDEPDALETITLLLEDEFRVLGATNAEEALRLLSDEFVAAVIADQRMPGMPGVDLLIEVRKQYPQVARVLLTAYADCAVLTRACNEAQIHRYIAKPWEPGEMPEVIADVIEEHGPILCPRKLTHEERAEVEARIEGAPLALALAYPEEEVTSEIAYPKVREDITVDEYVREASNGTWRGILLGSVGVLGGMALMGWGLIELVRYFLD